jgi:Asp-tRNA(Asn)/Glu-tRNA(Gln) amidotransferase A subunit family amidase
MKLNELTIEEILKGLAKKEFSCSELVRDCLANIEGMNFVESNWTK